MSDLTELSATALAAGIKAGALSAVDVVQAHLRKIEAQNATLHSWVCVASDLALNEAKAVDEARANGAPPLRKLSGVPFAVKDIINTKDLPTQMGSPIWKGFTPGNDARVVFDLRQQGAVMLGKTVTAEFAVHQLGDTVNPHDASRNPGTSSSGSAVAVATGQAPIALATQTAGSIVRPASYCGIYGFKPSFGLLPRTAMLKTTDSLDTVGFMARGAEDLRLVFDVVRVKGENFPISHAALSDESRQTKPAGRPWRVLVARPHTWHNVQPEARALFEAELQRWAKESDIRLEEAQLPESTRQAHEIHARIYERTLAYYFAEEAKKHQLISPVLNGMIERGRETTLDQYTQALAQQAAVAGELDAFLTSYDAVVTLSTSGEAPLRDGAELPDSCLLWTLAGVPALNVPALRSAKGLPIGIQLVARRYNDYLLLRFLDTLVERGLAPRGPMPVQKAAS